MVATARRLVILAWHLLTLLLTSNQPYRYAIPRSTEEKLRKLRVAATGQRRKTGPPPGDFAKSALTPGTRSRKIKSLPDIYASEQLPPLAVPPEGEAIALANCHLQDFAANLLKSQRILRPTKPPALP